MVSVAIINVLILRLVQISRFEDV